MNVRIAPSGITEALRRVERLPERVCGGINYHRGPPFANRLGYQLLRIFYKSASWHLRRAPMDAETRAAVDTLERDGCLVLPNFLQPAAFAAVRAEYDRSRSELAYRNVVVEDNGSVEELVDLHAHPEQFAMTLAYVAENAKIHRLVSAALRRPISARPRVWAKRWHRAEAGEISGQAWSLRGANHVHADMHYATFKAWLFLNDVDESNGAFQFARRSHLLTPARLAYEYEASIRVARSRKGFGSATESYAVTRLPTAQQLEAMQIKLEPVCCSANTLVLANMRGFHRQGEFQPGRVREALMMCFRSSEPGGLALLDG